MREEVTLGLTWEKEPIQSEGELCYDSCFETCKNVATFEMIPFFTHQGSEHSYVQMRIYLCEGCAISNWRRRPQCTLSIVDGVILKSEVPVFI